jgi:mono/diheme cytochrome c family protein
MQRCLFGGLLAVAAAVWGATAAQAQGLEIGKNEFLRSCASCHGATGKGDGYVAKVLIKPPPDLTTLTKANNGVFPFSRIYDAIDGRIDVIAHGRREMPVWGEFYTREWNSGLPGALASKEIAEAVTRVRILALIEYISTLQAK